MSIVKSEEKLRTLRLDIIYGVDHEPAKRVIPKFYDMVKFYFYIGLYNKPANACTEP